MKPSLLSVSQAAKLKGVSSSAVYKAIAQGRLPAQRVIGHLAVAEKDVRAWEELKAKTGRPQGRAISAEHRARIAAAQKARWQRVKSESGASKKEEVEISAQVKR